MRPAAYFLLACSLLLVAACQKDSNQALYDEVMAIHDEIMPKMDDLYRAKMALQQRLDSAAVDDAGREEIARKIAQIDAASESMMVWMREFNPIPDSEGKEKAREYLLEERARIQEIREKMLEALEQARE